MFRNETRLGALLLLICIAVSLAAGQSTTSSSNPVVPTLVNFSGTLNDVDGKPLASLAGEVTGIRQDAWANAHRIPAEERKNARERGHYIHPELFGTPEEGSIAWARHPQMMKSLKKIRETAAAPQTSHVAR